MFVDLTKAYDSIVLGELNINYTLIKALQNLYGKTAQVKIGNKLSHPFNTGLFINPSETSELDCATTKTDTAERSISIGREPLKVFFLY